MAIERLEHTFNLAVLIGRQPIFLAGLHQLLDKIGAAMHFTRITGQNELKSIFQQKKVPDLVIVVSPVIQNFKTSMLDKFYQLNRDCVFMLMPEDHELPLVYSFVQEGVKGVVTKSCTESELITALNSLHRNSFYFSPPFANAVIKKGLNSMGISGKLKLPKLSEREKDIIRLMWNDYTGKEIAEALNISVRTVESHRLHIYEKLKVNTLSGIFKYGLEAGIIC